MNPGEAVKMDSEYKSFLAELGGGAPPSSAGGGSGDVPASRSGGGSEFPSIAVASHLCVLIVGEAVPHREGSLARMLSKLYYAPLHSPPKQSIHQPLLSAMSSCCRHARRRRWRAHA